jgi:hypothetical protein
MPPLPEKRAPPVQPHGASRRPTHTRSEKRGRCHSSSGGPPLPRQVRRVVTEGQTPRRTQEGVQRRPQDDERQYDTPRTGGRLHPPHHKDVRSPSGRGRVHSGRTTRSPSIPPRRLEKAGPATGPNMPLVRETQSRHPRMRHAQAVPAVYGVGAPRKELSRPTRALRMGEALLRPLGHEPRTVSQV